jgi:hypothetical protein
MVRWYQTGLPFRDAFSIFHTVDLARSVSFYREGLGFEEEYRFGDSFVLSVWARSRSA